MPQTILVIDDSVEIHDLLEVRLKSEGWNLVHAHDGAQGLELAASLRPDLILLDVVMPGASGLEVCEQLKSQADTADIAVIFLSGDGGTFNKVKAFDMGAVDFVCKPFDVEELRARVRAALRTRRYHDLLAQRARIDALTGLWNRQHFDDRLAAEVAACLRYGRRLGLILFDLDHFKLINDGHGHPFGDRVLQCVGELLNQTARTADAACRYGGEEFAVILTETPVAGAMLVAERLRERIEALSLPSRGQVVKFTASFGVVSSDLLGQGRLVTTETLLAEADAALYLAKREGRNRVRLAAERT